MSHLSAETRRLLELSRQGDEAPAFREQRVRDALVSRLGMTALASAAAVSVVGTAGATSATTAGALTGSGSTAALGSAASVTSVSATTTTLVKTVTGLTLVASLGVGSIPFSAAMEPAHDPSHTFSVAQAIPSPPPIVESPSEPDEEPPPTNAALAPAVLPIDESVDHDPRRHEQLIAIARRRGRPVAIESEFVLVERAEQAFTARHYQLAQRYLSAHESKYADGALRENREALRVLIDCALGAAERARAGAARFAEVFADSDELPRVEACTKKL